MGVDVDKFTAEIQGVQKTGNTLNDHFFSSSKVLEATNGHFLTAHTICNLSNTRPSYCKISVDRQKLVSQISGERVQTSKNFSSIQK